MSTNTDPETSSREDQKIWILNGAENILNFYIKRYTFVRKNIVVCDDYLGPITVKKTKLSGEQIWNWIREESESEFLLT